MATDNRKTANPLTFGLALAAGLGLIAMIIALGYGVVEGEQANGSVIGGLFALGLALLITGVAAWLFVVQPFTQFDDIDEPKDTDPHGHDHHDDHAVVIHEPTVIEPTEPHAPHHP